MNTIVKKAFYILLLLNVNSYIHTSQPKQPSEFKTKKKKSFLELLFSICFIDCIETGTAETFEEKSYNTKPTSKFITELTKSNTCTKNKQTSNTDQLQQSAPLSRNEVNHTPTIGLSNLPIKNKNGSKSIPSSPVSKKLNKVQRSKSEGNFTRIKFEGDIPQSVKKKITNSMIQEMSLSPSSKSTQSQKKNPRANSIHSWEEVD